jgi:hypothetical protein
MRRDQEAELALTEAISKAKQRADTMIKTIITDYSAAGLFLTCTCLLLTCTAEFIVDVL